MNEPHWYVGWLRGKQRWHVFQTKKIPTKEQYSEEYSTVRGPFQNYRDAFYGAIYLQWDGQETFPT